MKNIFIAGITGSIGQNALKIIREFSDFFSLKGFTSHSNYIDTVNIIKDFNPEFAIITSSKNYDKLKNVDFGKNITTRIFNGLDSACDILKNEDFDIVLNAVVGGAGLKITWTSVLYQKRLCLANKESLVIAGEFVIAAARKNNIEIIPVDSEHSAIFQCSEAGRFNEIDKLWLTASGGPFLNRKNNFESITPADALKHPNWVMGNKITIDSATLMNKGLEVIEANHLFNMSYDKIMVAVHPESIIHSLVEFIDGNIFAQLGPSDMVGPIQYSFTYPDRKKNTSHTFNLLKCKKLTLKKPDFKRFPCLNLAYESGRAGTAASLVLNSSNEKAVELFLKKKINFIEIPQLINNMLDNYSSLKIKNIEDIFYYHKEILIKTEYEAKNFY
ncbi:MAG: 1-deoxy-D-xylulose-5-phosphate reductoisomerase [Candidatus Muiribacteriota bacterium]